MRVSSSRIRQARRAAGLRQKDLAEQLGMSASAVAAWERGDREPWPHNLARLAAVTGKDIAFFYDQSDEQVPA